MLAIQGHPSFFCIPSRAPLPCPKRAVPGARLPQGGWEKGKGARKYRELSRAKSSFSGQAFIRFPFFLAQKYITIWPKTMEVWGSLCGVPMAFNCSPQPQPCLLASQRDALIFFPAGWDFARDSRVVEGLVVDEGD